MISEGGRLLMSVREQTWNHLLKNLSLLEKMPGKQIISFCPEELFEADV